MKSILRFLLPISYLLLCAGSAGAVGTQALSIDPDTGLLVFPDPAESVQFANWSPSQFKIGGTQLVQTGTTVSITGGGTLSLGGFNFTVPGTGTGVLTSRNLIAGSGLTGGGDLGGDRTFSVGAGAGMTVNADDVALTTPGTLSVSSTNSSSGNHTHVITSNSNPGAAASILATNSSGQLTLVDLLANSTTFNLVNTAATTVNLAGAAATFTLGATTGTMNLRNATVQHSGTLVTPGTGYNTDLGQLSKKYKALYASELWVETLVAQNTVATIGGRILVGPTTTLIADLSTGATTIDVKHNQMSSGDRVYLEANGSVEFLAITSGPTTITGGYRYSVTRDLDGTGANAWSAGDAVFNTGTTGNGFIDLYSVQAVKGGSQLGPTIVGNVRNSSTYNDWTENWAIGNLVGLYGYGSTTYGVGLGKYASGLTNVTVDPTNGFRIRNFTTTLGQWDISGNILVGQTASSQGNVFISSAGTVSIRRGTTDYITLSTTDAQFTNLIKMSGANAAISIGSTPPTSATAGTGLWLDRTGLYSLSSNTQNVTLTSAGLNAGGGGVVLDQNGVTFAADVESGSTRFLQWKTGATQVGYFSTRYFDDAGAMESLTLNLTVTPSGVTNSYVQNGIRVSNNDSTRGAYVNARATGTAYTDPSKAWVEVSGTGFSGLLVGSSGGAPAHMLDVYGTGWFQGNVTVGNGGTGNARADVIINGGSGTGGVSSAVVRFLNNGTDAAAVGTEIAIVGSGSNTKTTLYSSNSTYRLYGMGAGTGTFDASGNITASSDATLKNIDGEFTRGSVDLLGIHPKLFHWKKETGLDTTEQYAGPIAQDVLPYVPEAVGLDSNGKHTLSDHVLVATLINSSNEHTVTLRKMQAQIDALSQGNESAQKAQPPTFHDPIDRRAAASTRLAGLKLRQSARHAAEESARPKPLPKPTPTPSPTQKRKK